MFEDTVFMSIPMDIALMYDEMEDCVSSFRRLIATMIGRYNFVIHEHQPSHWQG